MKKYFQFNPPTVIKVLSESDVIQYMALGYWIDESLEGEGGVAYQLANGYTIDSTEYAVGI